MRALTNYEPPAFDVDVALDLSKNEGRRPVVVEDGLPVSGACSWRRYPELGELREALACTYGVADERILVTAGGDDALLRLCLATLQPGRNALVATPTFEMIPRYVEMVGAELRTTAWLHGSFPTEQLLAQCDDATGVVFVVSPNNPTGCVVDEGVIARLAMALPSALIVLDAAYAEFADEDLTKRVEELDNVVVVRTLSKAWSMAGLRVGCAIAAADVVQRLCAAGSPMPVSSESARRACLQLRGAAADMRDHVRCVRGQREQLRERLAQLGVESGASQANFVLVRGLDARWVTAALASLGIAVRRFVTAELRDAVRIALPGTPREFELLLEALSTVFAPEALLFDMDGVLADVRASYRQAIALTAREFGVELSADQICEWKARGNANDDWQLTRMMLAERGVQRSLAEVTERFQCHYARLRDREQLLVSSPTLRRWRRRFPFAVVTGRPQAEAEHFLRRFGIEELFDVVICREHAALKPDPAPVALAMRRLGVRRAWMLGDTRDDMVAARGAGVVPVGVGVDPVGCRGAAAMLQTTGDLEELL